LQRTNGTISNATEKNEDLRQTMRALVYAALIGIGGVTFYALATGSTWAVGFSIIGVGILIAGAAFLIGSLLGFLFGIPKTIQQASHATPMALGPQQRDQQSVVSSQDAATGGGVGQNNRSASYRVNTNLEEISDWLTKILVGVGLTQLSKILGQFWLVAGKFAEAFGGAPGSTAGQAVVAVLMVHFLTTGFFFGYLLTRLFLTGAFIRAEERSPLEEMRAVVQEAHERTREEFIKVSERTQEAVKGMAELASVESQMISLLYREPPSGFQEAIQRGEAFVQHNREAASAVLWVYLACAYGQQYSWESAHENRPEVLRQSREKALDAVRMALEKDKTVRPWLAGLLHPTPGSVDNDLEIFQEDREFEDLLGEPGS
jgi:hypothetical protein